jgi:hypothetical protein
MIGRVSISSPVATDNSFAPLSETLTEKSFKRGPLAVVGVGHRRSLTGVAMLRILVDVVRPTVTALPAQYASGRQVCKYGQVV